MAKGRKRKDKNFDYKIATEIDQIQDKIDRNIVFIKTSDVKIPGLIIPQYSDEQLGESYKKLINWGWSMERIVEHTGKSDDYIKECLSLVGYVIE